MIVAGLSCDASTMRSRNWLADQRLPAPARLGARSPWNLVSGNGPEWQRMQVAPRSTTSARPRAASPGVPVSDCGMPSPTIVYGLSSSARAGRDSADSAAISQAPAIWIARLAKTAHRDRREPSLRFVRFASARLARRIGGAAAAAFDLGKNVVLWRVEAGER